MAKRKEQDPSMVINNDYDPRLEIFNDKSITIPKAFKFIQDEAEKLMNDFNDASNQEALMVLMREREIRMGEDEAARFERNKEVCVSRIRATIFECEENIEREVSAEDYDYLYLFGMGAKRIFNDMKAIKAKYDSCIEVLRKFPVDDVKKNQSAWKLVFDSKFVRDKVDMIVSMVYGVEFLIREEEKNKVVLKKAKIDDKEEDQEKKKEVKVDFVEKKVEVDFEDMKKEDQEKKEVEDFEDMKKEEEEKKNNNERDLNIIKESVEKIYDNVWEKLAEEAGDILSKD
jgi:hypothetical protein